MRAPRRVRRAVRGVVQPQAKVVCIGLPKTGTTSFGDAMLQLGYRHKPFGDRVFFPSGYPFVLRYQLMKYESFDDYPWFYAYEFVKKKYPRAKFVLTKRRNPEVWLESLKRHYSLRGKSRTKFDTFSYNDPTDNEGHHLRLYESHMSRVRHFFEGSPNLLEVCWETGDGWRELCGFLDKPVPDVPFPVSNRSADTLSRISALGGGR